jgi:Divergent InlB B-repeat domain
VLAGDQTATGTVFRDLPAPVASCTTATGTCTYMFPRGTSVTLHVQPDAGFGFDSWSNAFCTGQAQSCSFALTASDTVQAAFSPLNRVFVTKPLAALAPNALTLTGADTTCNQEASGTFPGTYKAWLSTSTESAKDRLVFASGGAARGWMRPPDVAGGYVGTPFVDTVADLIAGKIYSPVLYDKTSTRLTQTDQVETGTGSSGVLTSNCSNWSVTVGTATSGVPTGTTSYFTQGFAVACSASTGRVYCFGNNYNAAIFLPPPMGVRLAFVTQQDLIPGVTSGAQKFIDISDADALCVAEATAATLANPTNFKALLATGSVGGAGGQAAAARFNLSGPTWARVDGIRILNTAADLNATFPALLSTISVSANKVYDLGATRVWTGSAGVDAVPVGSPAPGSTCNNWADGSGTYQNSFGVMGLADPRWWLYGGGFACTSGFGSSRIYCLED